VRVAVRSSRDIERLPRAALDRARLDRLREVLAYARSVDPFYRRLWQEAGVGPEEVRTLEDLRRFPIVSKRDLLQAGRGTLEASRAPVGFSTRGTSGEPLLLWLGPEEEEAYIEPTVRGFRWAGLAPGDTALLMSPVWHRLAACEAHAAVRLGARAVFPWGSLAPGFVGEFAAALRKFRPQFLTTTAPFLLSVVRACADEGRDPAELFRGVRSAVVVGQPLTPGLRSWLQERLGGCEVFERSGTQEGAALDECPERTGPHVHEDVCCLEVVGETGEPLPPGRRGRLVVTKLVAGGSPFVRYDTGDRAAFLPGPCPCGRSFERLKIFGRPETSVLVEGRLVTAYDVRACVEAVPSLAGRNLLLVRDAKAEVSALRVAIEGVAAEDPSLEGRLREALGVSRVEILWLGKARLAWGFRQVVEPGELALEEGGATESPTRRRGRALRTGGRRSGKTSHEEDA
jgi:phenylacetate-CoA ligase